MTVTLFNNTNMNGASLDLDRGNNGDDDYASLKDNNFNNRATSLSAGVNDAVLLFKDKEWKGNVLYVRGRTRFNNLENVRTPSDDNFSNKISSARLDPFIIYLNFVVVTGRGGELPGHWQDRDQTASEIQAIMLQANDFFERENALVKVKFRDTRFRKNEKKFNMTENERKSIPLAWKKKNTVDIIFVNRLENAVGIGSSPGGGKFVVMAVKRNPSSAETVIDKLSRTFVHELGHYWSLKHGTDIDDIMTQSDNADPLSGNVLRRIQVNEIHQTLSKDIRRRGERYEE